MRRKDVEDIAATLASEVVPFDPFELARRLGYYIVFKRRPAGNLALSFKIARIIFVDPRMPADRIWHHICHEIFEMEMGQYYGHIHEDVADHGGRAMMLPRTRFMHALGLVRSDIKKLQERFPNAPLDQLALRIPDLVEETAAGMWTQESGAPTCSDHLVGSGMSSVEELPWHEKNALYRVWTLTKAKHESRSQRMVSRAWRTRDWGPRQAIVVSYRFGAF
jgi:hypothetical protein